MRTASPFRFALDGGTPWFVMEYAEKLPARLFRDQVIAVVDRIAEALQLLDEKKHQHGDVKPNNIGLINGKAVLLDFGTVRSHGETEAAALRLGTPYYMAPELKNGGTVSARTDVFSLGVTLEEMRDEADCRVFNPVIHRATARTPIERPTYREFRQELKDAVGSYRRDAAKETRVEKFKAVAKRAGWTVMALLFCMFGAALYNRSHKSFETSNEIAALRHAEAETRIGRASYFNRDFTNAVIHLERAVETLGYANPEAYGMLADCYRRGRGAKKDLEKSRRYAQFAADRGDERGKKVLQRLD